MWLAFAAFAHDDEGELAVRPFVRGGELVGVWSTNGLATRDEDGSYGLVCTEALPAFSDAWLRTDGAFLVATDTGVRLAPDAACELVEEPTYPGFVTRFEPVGAALYGRVSRSEGDLVVRSLDEGSTWVELPALPDGPWIVEGTAADGQDRFVAAGQDALGLAVATWDGTAWTTVRAPDDPDAFFLLALGPAPDGQGVGVATLHLTGASRLWASSGAGWVPLVDLPETPTGYGCLGAGCLVATQGALYRWEPAAGAASLGTIVGPSQCLLLADDAFWACERRTWLHLVEVSRDGLAFELALLTGAALDRPCKPECDPPRDDTTTPATDEETAARRSPRDEGKGCRTAPSSAVALLLLLPLVRRERA